MTTWNLPDKPENSATAGFAPRSFTSNTGYTFKQNRLQPRVGLAVGFNSGDKNPNDLDLQTFSPPFPRGRYFWQIGANGPNNINGFSPSASLEIVNKITVTADSYFFFRKSLNDGIYGVPGNLIRSGKNSRARFIGAQPQIEGVWQIDRHLSFTASYARFFIGDFIKQTAPQRQLFCKLGDI